MIREHILTTQDADSWNEHLPPSRSVFGSLGYARICEAFRNCLPRLYIAAMNEASICYPLHFRSISELPFAFGTEGRWDTTTPEFTGPIANGFEPALAEAFPFLRDKMFRREGVVAEFAHLYPWGEAGALLPEGREYNRTIVWIDTGLSLDELWSTHLGHSCRKNIKTAQREGVTIFEGSTDDHIREFYRIYIETMQRNNALTTYYFCLDFFRAFRDELSGNCRFAMAEYRDRIVAATLYLHDDTDVYSFLGGADAESQQVRPTNLLVWETIQWANLAGKRRLILGGGYRPNDGIFRFKSTFSRFQEPFYVYRKIHHEQEYNLLDQRCREHNALSDEPIKYFPSYRYTGKSRSA
jgi:hypothetical protein